jgi:NitT/TauT family transport system ATP-binding protein
LAVADFNLTLEDGEFYCLLGPSGCGKSTILSLLAGFTLPSAGRIELSGQVISGASRDRGVVFQGDDSLYPWLTALENVEFGLRLRGMSRRDRRDRAVQYLELVGLRGQEGKHPPELSGGMKQRVQIARALANEPRILLMDEPFGALDAQTRGGMQVELRRIWERMKVTVVFITHDIDEAIVLGTRVGVMTAGPGGTLKENLPIDIPGERTRTDPRYTALYGQIHALVRAEVLRASARSAA